MAHELSTLFNDPRVHVVSRVLDDACIGDLSQKEAAAIAGAVSKRKREFATARALVRDVLTRHYGIRGFDLLNAGDRAPIWPPGIIGSISHSDSRAWVAVADRDVGSIGIDGEGREGLDRSLWRLTLRDNEMRHVLSLPHAVRARRALLMFSAKEALFKAQYTFSLSFVSFTAASITVLEDGRLSCAFHHPVGLFPRGFVAHGRWLDDGNLVTAVWIPARPLQRQLQGQGR